MEGDPHQRVVSTMVATPTSAAASPSLLRNRNRTVAKSFYRELRSQGFSSEQIIELSAALLDLVHEDMCQPVAEAK